MKLKVTLVGERQARVGFRFLFEGTTELCSRCEVRNVCLGNLESGRMYEVRKVSRKRFPCLLHFEDAVVVEVDEPPVGAAVETRTAINNALITYTKIDCANRACENWRRCSPAGLVEADRCRIVEVKGSLQCPLKMQLQQVSLQRQPQAS
ncbi:UPF0179 family protein [Candidatus Bathyarchaeota archaeon]|nr:UPF0179 family protein [Candidatus Bathyarchaeota archaeon]